MNEQFLPDIPYLKFGETVTLANCDREPIHVPGHALAHGAVVAFAPEGLPVTVVSTSANLRDVNACYACGANAYVQKPLDYDDFIGAVRAVIDFWLNAAVLPKAIF